jgi:hypothetical protein
VETHRSKIIYRTKKGVNKKVETFKPRLVVKRLTQKEGIDYEKTFSPVTVFKSIKVLLTISCQYANGC